MRDGLARTLARGAAAGMAGTVAMWSLQMGSQKWLARTLEPVREDPGEFMVQWAEAALPAGMGDRLPEAAENALAQSLHFGYGTTFGTLYAVLRPGGGNELVDGMVLGLGTWAVGYLGWVPAVDLAPPVKEHEPQQILGSLVRHALYGIATVAAFRQLQKI
jgi:hypothetical protein